MTEVVSGADLLDRSRIWLDSTGVCEIICATGVQAVPCCFAVVAVTVLELEPDMGLVYLSLACSGWLACLASGVALHLLECLYLWVGYQEREGVRLIHHQSLQLERPPPNAAVM